MMTINALKILFIYWFLNGTDRLMSWQTLTRPLVVGPFTGLILGDLHTGIIMGASLEGLFMGISAIGGSLPADPFSSTIIAVAYTILTGHDTEAGLAIAMPIGTAMAALANMFAPFLASLAPYWENLAYKGNMRNFRIQVCLCGIFVDRLAYFIVLFFSVAYGIEGLQAFLNSMPHWVMSGLAAASSMMTGVGFAILVSMIWSREVGGFFFVGFVLSKYLNLGPLPIAIIATVAAIMYFYNDKKILELKTALAASDNAVKTSGVEDDFFDD